MKQLIVNADDFGRSPGVNRGIFDAYHKGIVTSTTVMIGQPYAPTGLEQALNETPDLGLGLHLNLTAGPAVSDPAAIPTLIDPTTGFYYTLSDWITHVQRIDPDDIRREIQAQFDRFISLTGKKPDHLDAHYHITYLHPVGLDMMLTLSEQYNIPMRQAQLDLPATEAIRALHEMLPQIPSEFAMQLIENLHEILAQHQPPFWPARLDMGFYGARAILGELLLILTNLGDDSLTEVMCHPGYVDEHLNGNYVAEREAEVNHLTHAATRECIKSEQIQLITFGDLTR
jgi:predicted glycoside hydrolase/deacetylase ChbG (UPF0249 family)